MRRRAFHVTTKSSKLEVAGSGACCFWKLFDMQYDCVIATKNRLDALRMSIPLILKQDVLPGRLIVIDASDDHDSVNTEVHEITERLGFQNTIVAKSDASNSARQRNIGLQFVEAPVVMFPDDDSMWYSGFATNVMKIYEADVRRQVGGVSGVGVPAPPPELAQPTYKKERACEREGRVAALSKRLRKSSLSSPFRIDCGNDLDRQD